MTEKRFEFFKDGDEIYCRDVFDDFNYPMYDESTAKDIVNFMNYLYDERKEVSKNFYRFYKEDYCNLEEENEQLRKELQTMVSDASSYLLKIQEIEKENDGLNKDLKRIVREHQHLQMKFQRLQRENEQLKKQLADCEIKKQNHKDMLMNSKPVTDQKRLQKIIYGQVIALIDMRIKAYEHKPFSAPIRNPANPNYDADVDRLARLSELQQLKEELKR